MNCVKLGVLAGLLLGSLALPAQKSYKFRVQLTDKQSTTYSLDKPEEFLSERAVQRRVRQGIALILRTCLYAGSILKDWKPVEPASFQPANGIIPY